MKTSKKKIDNKALEPQSIYCHAASAYPIGELLSRDNKDTVFYCKGPGALTTALEIAQIAAQNGQAVLFISPPELVAKIKHRVAAKKSINSGIDNRYTFLRQRWLSQLNRSVFSQQKGAEIAGLYLASTTHKEAEILDRQLAFGDLDFNAAAYLSYCEQIRLTQKIYLKVGYLPPVLQELNAGIFRHQELEDAQAFIDNHLNKFIEQSAELASDMATTMNIHLRQRRLNLRKQKKELNTALEAWENAIKAFVNETKKGRIKRSLRKKLLNNITVAQTELQQKHHEGLPFGFEWANEKGNTGDDSHAISLQQFKAAFEEWADNHRQQLRGEQIALSAATDPDRRESWERFSNELTDLIERINNSGLFQRPLAGMANTVSRQQKVLEQLLEKLRSIKQLQPQLPAFFNWQQHWFRLPAALRRIVSPLLAFPDLNWQAAFSAWYFENGLLENIASPTFIEFDEKAATATEAANPDLFREISVVGPTQLPSTQFDLIIDLCGASNKLARPTSTLLLCEPKKDEKVTTIYFSRYGNYLPGQAFCQEWSSSSFPDWSTSNYPNSPNEAIFAQQAFFGQATADNSAKILRPNYSLFVQLTANEAPILWQDEHLLEEGLYAAQLMLPDLTKAPEELAHILPKLWACCQRISIATTAQNNTITDALLTDGFSAPYAIAAMLRAMEAIVDKDDRGWRAIAAETRKRQGAPTTASSPLIKEIVPHLAPKLPQAHLSAHVGWRDLYLPLVVQMPNGKKWVVLPDDLVPGADTIAVEAARRRELETAGFKLTYLLTEDILTNIEATLDRLVEEILNAVND